MLHRVIKYQLNSYTGKSYCSLMFTSVLSDIRLLLSFFILLSDNPKTIIKKTPNKNKQPESLLGVIQSVFHRRLNSSMFYNAASTSWFPHFKMLIKAKGDTKQNQKGMNWHMTRQGGHESEYTDTRYVNQNLILIRLRTQAQVTVKGSENLMNRTRFLLIYRAIEKVT